MNFGKKTAGRDMAGFVLLGISLIMLGKSLMLCFSNDIWYDELFTVGMAEHSYGEMIRFTAADVHPPLYYCIVKLFADLCKLFMPGTGTIMPAKIVSVLPYFILLLYAVTFIRKRFGMFIGGMFLFCVMAMPQLSAYTVEVRMYSWALLFVTAAFLHGYALVTTGGTGRCSRNGKETNVPCADCGRDGAGSTAGPGARRQKQTRVLHGTALTLYGLAAAYTQYFACVAVAMVYLYVLLAFWFRDRRRIREWLCYVVISAIGYAPWLFVLGKQVGAVSENYWILPLTWRSLGGCVKFLMKPAFANEGINTVLAVILFFAYLILWCRWAFKLCFSGREKEKRQEIGIQISGTENIENADGVAADRFWFATAGVGVLAGLVAFGFAASFLIRPIFVYRYMIPALGCFWLGFALCLDCMLCKLPDVQSRECFVDRDKSDWRDNGLDGSSRYRSGSEEKGRYHGGGYDIGRNRNFRVVGIALSILVVVVGLRDYRAFMGEEEYKIRLMAETEAVLATIGPQDSVLYNFDQVQAVTGYYLPETAARFLWCAEGERLIQEITSPCGTVENAEEIHEMLEKSQEEEKERSLWFIGSFNSREDIAAEWRQAGLEVEELGSFLLERYWFNLYKIS